MGSTPAGGSPAAGAPAGGTPASGGPGTPIGIPGLLPILGAGAPAPAGDTSVASTAEAEPPLCGDVASAASVMSWGAPSRAEEFGSANVEGWTAYVGPGYQGRGNRSPSAVAVEDGLLTINGDAHGTTGGMAWGTGQTYGRWEARARIPAGDAAYDAVLMLWPDSDDPATGGELDFMESQDPTRATTIAAVHHGAENTQVGGTTAIDATQWHNWAVEWTPTRIATFVDGKQWFETTDPAAIPTGPMHLCVQLDYFGTDAAVAPSSMEVDWVKQYPLPAAPS